MPTPTENTRRTRPLSDYFLSLLVVAVALLTAEGVAVAALTQLTVNLRVVWTCFLLANLIVWVAILVAGVVDLIRTSLRGRTGQRTKTA
jgi:putative copper export protein